MVDLDVYYIYILILTIYSHGIPCILGTPTLYL